MDALLLVRLRSTAEVITLVTGDIPPNRIEAWDGACGGDSRFDLVRYAFDLDGHDQPVWEVVESTGIEARVLRAYVAHHVLRCTAWAIRHRPEDVPRQLDRAERVLDRHGA